MTQALIVVAGLMGAAGVALAAAGAHAKPGLESAGYILLFHAPAVMAAVLAMAQGTLGRSALPAAIGLALGAILFAGDLTLRAFVGARLFPMAAPTGGFILIASWLALAMVAILAARG
jgi:uncharacterized membrane protein YgdD (TMEM256/DUF423 family)